MKCDRYYTGNISNLKEFCVNNGNQYETNIYKASTMFQALYVLYDYDDDGDDDDASNSSYMLRTCDHTNEGGMDPALLKTYKLAGKADIEQIIPSVTYSVKLQGTMRVRADSSEE